MHFRLLIFLLILNCSQVIYAQPEMDIVFSTEEDEYFTKSFEDNDENIIVIGIIGDRSSRIYDPYLVKITPDGSYESKRFIFQDTLTIFYSGLQLENGDYLMIGGYSLEVPFNWKNLWLVELDTNLNIVSQVMYEMIDEGGFYYRCSYGNLCVVDQDDNIIISGHKYESDKGDFQDISFVKINQELDTLFSKTHHYQYGQIIREFQAIPNSSQYQAIVQALPLQGESPVILDSALNIIQTTSYINQPQFDVDVNNPLSSKHWLNDTTYLLSCLNITPEHERQIAVLAIDTAVNLYNELYLNKVDTSDYPAWLNSMAYVNDSTIFIGGMMNFMEFFPTYPSIIELYMIDKDLNVLGYYEYGGDANYEVFGIQATSDEGCIVYGTRRTEENTTESDGYIFKVLREDFDITTEMLEIKAPGETAMAYPNPAKDHLFIKLDEDFGFMECQFKIYNLAGKLMTSRKIAPTGNILKVNIVPLKPGHYVYHLSNNEFNINGKFIKVN